MQALVLVRIWVTSDVATYSPPNAALTDDHWVLGADRDVLTKSGAVARNS